MPGPGESNPCPAARLVARAPAGTRAPGTGTVGERRQPDHPVADRGRGEVPPGGERFEAGRGHHVPLPGDVVQPAAVGVDRYGAVAEPCPLRRVRRAAGPRPPRRQSRLHRLALEHKTEARALSGLVVAAAGPRAESGSRVGPLHQRFGLAPPPLAGPSPPRPGRHPFSCRCTPRGHCRDHARVPGRWPCAPRCRSAASPP